jgi:hypothetical protein
VTVVSGLLQADLIDAYLLQYYAMAAHGYTRGTWIAPESSYIDRTQMSPSLATPAGMVAPHHGSLSARTLHCSRAPFSLWRAHFGCGM